MTSLLPLDAEAYEPSELHGPTRIWGETSCYVDMWVELLHSLGLDPVPALAFVLASDFEGDQWRFLKFPLEDLWELFGIETFELNPWRGVEVHIDEQLRLGRTVTLEVDSWYLPDTAGVSYGEQHVKSSIVPNLIDPDARRLGYFHGAGYHELRGLDYVGALRPPAGTAKLAPYVEVIRLESMRSAQRGDVDVEVVRELVARHLRRRPSTSPVAAMRKRLEADLDWLIAAGPDAFHDYAFVTMRQCGAASELAASLCEWLVDRGLPFEDAQVAFAEVAALAKVVQFKMARLLNGRAVDLGPPLDSMEELWESAISTLAAHHDR